MISAFQQQPKKTKHAAIECLFFCLLAFTAPLLYFLPVLANFNLLPNGKQLLIYAFWQFLGMIMPFLLIIMIGTVMYVNLRIIFDYKLPVLFYGIMFSVFSMYTFLLYNSITTIANPSAVRPENGHIYWLLIVFFYPLILNSVLLFRGLRSKEKSENFQIKVTWGALLGVVFLILSICVGFLEEPAFVKEFNLTFLLLVPATVVLGMMYKLLFRKPVTSRSIAYLPLAIFLIYLISFQISPGFPDMLTRGFDLSEYISYMAVGCLVSFIFMIFVWLVNRIGSAVLRLISDSDSQNTENA